MARIEGADASHWQSAIDFSKFPGKFVIIKIGGGNGHEDDKAAINAAAAKAAGKKIGPYFFVTSPESAAVQYSTCMKIIEKLGIDWDLRIHLDWELYNQLTLEPFYQLNEGDFKFPFQYSLAGRVFGYESALNLFAKSYGLVIPTAQTVYDLLTRLKGWNGFDVPALYSNPSTLNAYAINSSTRNWKQFFLWDANWNVPAPNIPTAWKGEDWYLWQDRVIADARDWGVDGALDHDYWGDKIPFPGDTPVEQAWEFTARALRDGVDDGIWCGKLERKC